MAKTITVDKRHPMVQASYRSVDGRVKELSLDMGKKILTTVFYQVEAWKDDQYTFKEVSRDTYSESDLAGTPYDWDSDVAFLVTQVGQFPAYFPVNWGLSEDGV